MSSDTSAPWRTLASLLLGCGLLAGCASWGRVTATGTVTFEGQSVETGAIVFLPLDQGMTPQGATISAGKYAVRCRPGRHRVEIRGTREIAESHVPPTMPRIAGAPVREDFIPAAYNTESTLEVTVSAGGPNVFDFDLKSSSAPR